MEELRCLYLEDDDDDFETYKQSFVRAMEPVAKLSIDRAKTPQQVYDKLDSTGATLHLFFADLLMAEESKEGLRVVEYVTATFPKIVVIGISKAEGSHPGTAAKFKKQAGPDSWFFDKRLMKDDYTYLQIREEIVEVVKRKGYLLSEAEVARIDWTPDRAGNEKLDAEIDSIGFERLLKLLKQIAPESTNFKPHYLAPGLSGASVLRISGTGVDCPPRNLLVKFSTDRPKLERELAAAPKEGEPSSHVYVPYLASPSPWHYEGMFAIAGRFEDEAITLQEWLTNPDINPADTVREVFDEFLLHGLGKAYLNGKTVAGATAMDLLGPNVRTRARMLISLELMKSLIPRTGIDVDLSISENFARFRGQINTHPATAYPQETHICLSHGDLHSRNILIDIPSRSRPKLIDTARRAERHWASDPARLAADLWMSAWDRDTDGYFWDRLPTWRAQIKSWRHRHSVKVEKKSSNRRVWDGLVWIRGNIGELFDLTKAEFAYWQFDLALALEFLSMSSYLTVPMPKRCLGVLAASDILADLDATIPWTV
jgi:hypothetical protein